MRLIRPDELKEERRAKAEKPKARRSSERARQAAIEKQLAKYTEMTCGHFVSRESIERDSAWQPSKGLYYCYQHDDWFEKKPAPKAANLPEEPPF